MAMHHEPTTQREAPLDGALKSCDSANDELEQALDVLEQRLADVLQPVLQPSMPSIAVSRGAPEPVPVQSKTMDRLQSMCGRTRAAARKVHDLLQRLDT